MATKKTGCAALGCASLLVLGVIGWLAIALTPTSSTAPPANITSTPRAQAPADADETNAFVMCKDFVKDRLKAPASADFPWLDRQVTKRGPGRFTVVSYVDAQNAFGAKIRTHYSCTVSFKGGSVFALRDWTLESLKFE
jgi:hypothetical protein